MDPVWCLIYLVNFSFLLFFFVMLLSLVGFLDLIHGLRLDMRAWLLRQLRPDILERGNLCQFSHGQPFRRLGEDFLKVFGCVLGALS